MFNIINPPIIVTEAVDCRVRSIIGGNLLGDTVVSHLKQKKSYTSLKNKKRFINQNKATKEKVQNLFFSFLVTTFINKNLLVRKKLYCWIFFVDFFSLPRNSDPDNKNYAIYDVLSLPEDYY